MASPSKNGKSKTSSSKSKKNKSLEYTVAALLLTGKLRVDSVQLFREASLVITLTGQYKTLAMNGTNIDKMVKFLDNNGDMTLNEVIEALKKKSNNS
ncbi:MULTISPECIES: hypothetical protein [Paenibacillus]|uniref:hypothetical protein n=1 Tax=Paenibacillus TaxID=44249 RepID=UPI000DA60ECE|nr:hypothetical protein [Paenibacillus bouchesdurhonensis]